MLVNGDSLTLQSGWTLLDLLAYLNIKPQTVAIEYNGEIPERSRWGQIELKEADRIEVIHFVGGG
ncbi:MAG: sulfur carrier protein ThiS [Spirochaetales bacterium]|nr:sulfur carrier protein ThiS [Spirochaetales bacterium]